MNFLKKILIIAEIACSHEGDFLKAKKLVDCAFNAKVDAIKFQKFTANELYESSHKSFQMAKNLEFTNSEWKKLVNYAKKKNLLVFADVFGINSGKFMSTLRIDGFKIHSSDMTNPEILNYFSKINLPILLSTAGCNLNEIHEALKILDKNKKNLTLMHGFQGYPTKILDINLRRLIELQNNFGINVGLMDHISGHSSMSTVIPLLGICFGATIIEKHITLDRDQKGTDYHSALNPNEFKKLVKLIRETEKTLGTQQIKMNNAEAKYRINFKKTPIAKKPLSKNTILSDNLFKFKRTNISDSVSFLEYRGKKLFKNLQKGQALRKNHIKHNFPKICAVLACRLNSTRLYAKPLQDLGETKILELLINELQQSKRISDVILAISEKPENHVFVDFAKTNNIKFVLGSDEDVLQRLIHCANVFAADAILRITPENPFMYWEKIDDVIDSHFKKKSDLTVTIGAPLGSNFEIISLKALELSHKLGRKKHRSEMVSLFINENQKKFKIQKYRVEKNVWRPNYRLTIDYPEDLVVARIIFENMGNGTKPIPLSKIIKFLDNNPEILKINIDKNTIYQGMWLKNK